uniref:hypothetical protein n=1 Tax=Pseudomonas fluorescens TaxID=294 RepID=UPI00186696EF|nr:hypothetical protein [Pseudomonas fluorescens]
MNDYQLIQCSAEDLQELQRLALAVRAASDDDDALGNALDNYDEHANPDQVLCLFEAIDQVTAERDTLRAQLTELLSAVRSINHGRRYEVKVPGDDEPQYRQRKEWVDWVLSLCDTASASVEPRSPGVGCEARVGNGVSKPQF